MARRVCLAIGVANAKPLEWLPGAANAARDIGDWARCSGFDAVTVLTDESSVGQTRWAKGADAPSPIAHPSGLPVTVPRVAEEIRLLFPRAEATEWFILHFAGHGLREDITRTLWLQSDWKKSKRAIAVEALKRNLETYGIENLTIISDSCRDFANGESTGNLSADGVIGEGPVQPVAPAVDRFNAVYDGKQAFMIPGKKPADARCILTGTIANALWGHEPGAFFKYEPDQIVSTSLLNFVALQSEAIGAKYGLESKAETVRGHSGKPDLVYYDRNRPPQPQAGPVVWPPPAPAPAPREQPSPEAVAAAMERIVNLGIPGTTKFFKARGFPLSTWGRFDLQAADEVFVLAEAVQRAAEPGLTRAQKRAREWRTDVAEAAVRRTVSQRRRTSRRSSISTALREAARRQAGDGNLVLRGGVPVRVWSAGLAVRLGRRKAWSVELAPPRGPVPRSEQILVEYADGLFAPMVVYPGLVTVAVHKDGRMAGWMCLPPGGTESENFSATVRAIAGLQSRSLSPGSADALATELRYGKHQNPMLGAIAAYLYDYVGDRDSIRRMAWYYASHGEPIPYDVALLGLIETRRRADGRLIARIPAVPERRPQRDRQEPEFVTRATPARQGVVAGLCPWLRQGWDFVAVPEPVERPMTDRLQAALPHLLNSSFTALSREGAEALIETWKLEADG